MNELKLGNSTPELLQSPGTSTTTLNWPSSGLGTSAPGPIRRRRFSTAKIQPTRIKKVMQSDEEIGRMVASVPVAIGRAMELFAEKFLQASSQVTLNTNSRTLTPAHMKQAMLNNPHFRFLEPVLKDIAIPQPKPGSEEDPSFKQFQTNGQDVGCFSAIPSPVYPILTGAMSLPFSNPLASLASLQSQFLSSTISPAPSVIQAVPEVPVPAKKEKVERKPSEPQNTDNEGKPKRGRPRKIKKEEKCIDDELCKEVSSVVEQEDRDRERMPPPALPIGLARAKPLA